MCKLYKNLIICRVLKVYFVKNLTKKRLLKSGNLAEIEAWINHFSYLGCAVALSL